MPGPRVVFFDLGDTLIAPRFSASGEIAAFDPFPFVPDVLSRMKAPPPAGFGARLGILSNTPPGMTLAQASALLEAARILTFFDPPLILLSSVEGLDKTRKEFFTLAASRAGVPPARCVFTGESEAERKVAIAAGFHPSFHPLHAFHVVAQLA